MLDENKEQLVKEKLLRREAERQQLIERNRELKEQKSSGSEQVGFFYETFTDKQREVDDALKSAIDGFVERSLLPNHFDKIRKNIQELQHFISSSTFFLRVYDIRKVQEIIQNLQQKVQQSEEQLIPKKKFGFKGRKVTIKKDISSKKIEDTIDSSVPTIPNFVGNYLETNYGFSNKSGEILSLPHEKIYKKDIILSALEDCTVQLTGASSTLHITNLHNSKVMCGPVSTSVFIENCSNCVFILACQQLRVHGTRHSDFYLHVTSRAIIEDTTDVRFAPYQWKYENIISHFQMSGLDMNKNNWDLVDDFNWLASDKPSPNWQIMKDNDQNLDFI